MTIVAIGFTQFVGLSYARDPTEIRFNRFYFDDSVEIPPEQIAGNLDIWSGHYNVLRVGKEVKQYNPNAKIFLYRNLRDVWNKNHAHEYNTEELELFKRNGWILKDSTGNYVRSGDTGFLVDVGNPSYRAWVAQWFKNYAIEYNISGVWLDNCFTSREMLWGPVMSVPINPRTGNMWTDQEFFDATVAIVNTVKGTLGPNICVMGNGIYNGNNWVNRKVWYQGLMLNSSLDGIMSEGWSGNYSSTEWDNETVWLRSMDMAVWINKNFLSKGNKLFIPLMYNAARNVVPDGDKEKYALYTYASILLAAYYDGNSLGYGSYFLNQELQGLFKTRVGVPLTEYAIIPNSHVYSREFSLAKVYVNPSNKEYLVDGFWMEPYSGKIVIYVQSAPSAQPPKYSVFAGPEIFYTTLIIAVISIIAIAISFFLRYHNINIYYNHH